MAGEEVAEPPQLVAGDALQWGEFPLVSAVSPPTKPPWSMVAIRNHQKHGPNDPPIIFPPVDHENLHISPDLPPTPDIIPHIHSVNRRILFSDTDSDSDSNSSSSFSLSDSTPSPPSPLISARPAADVAGWFGAWTDFVNCKVNCLMQYFFSMLTSTLGVFTSSRSVAFTAVLLAFLYFRRRRNLRAGQESSGALIGVIKERDEKINQLLDQLTRMNQALLAVHKAPSP